jgi:hypothetical protein
MNKNYMYADNFLSQKSMLVPASFEEFLILHDKASPEIVFHTKRILNPIFQGYSYHLSKETTELITLIGHTIPNFNDSNVSTFIFEYMDMHIAYPSREFSSIEDMKESFKFNLDHGRAYNRFKDSNAPDIETFVKLYSLGYKNFTDYSQSLKENTSAYYAELNEKISLYPQNIKEKFFNISGDEITSLRKINTEADFFYLKLITADSTYDKIIDSFIKGFENFGEYLESEK